MRAAFRTTTARDAQASTTDANAAAEPYRALTSLCFPFHPSTEEIIMFDKTEGAFQNIAGRVQEAFGAATGDTGTEYAGKARRAAGGAQYGYGRIVESLREAAVKNPVGTVAVVAGACFVLGALWSAKR